jgi:hypothetical protein
MENLIKPLALSIIVVLVASGALVYTTYGSGNLIVKMQDPPAGWGPAEEVYISFSDILLHRSGADNESGWFSTGISYVNLTLSDMVNITQIIGEKSLQAGLYNVIRFNMTQAIVTVNGVNYTCTIESGKLNVPITNGGVRISAGGTSFIVIDVEPKVTGANGNYKFTPAIKSIPHVST